MEEKNNLQKKANSLDNELKGKDSEILKLNKIINLERTDEDTTKKILSYFAKGCQYSVIMDKMIYNNFDVSIEHVKDVCLNIEDLDNEFVLHYRKERESYEESIKINPEILKNDMIILYDLLINEATMDLQSCSEVEERRKIREEINKHIDKKNNVLKNIVEDKTSKAVEKVVNSMSKIDKLNESVSFTVIEEEFVN